MKLSTPLAWRNLTHDLRRLIVAVSGVAFAVILIFMELGFLNALLESTVQVLRKARGEIVLISPSQYSIIAAERFDVRRLYDARTISGVAAASPIYIETTSSILRTKGKRGYPIRVLAVRPEDHIFAVPELTTHGEALQTTGMALADLTSRRKYEFPRRGQPLESYVGELNGKELRLTGRFHLGIDFATEGNLLMTTSNFARYFPGRAGGGDPLRAVDLGMVQLEEGADPKQVREQLRQTLPPDVVPFLKDQLIEREMTFWRVNAPLGYIFMVGAIMGFIVGVLICYQIIYSDIADHMREFATLKAMGYGNLFFLRLVLRQCVYLSLLGFAPGLLVSWISYRLLASITGLTMIMTPGVALGVLATATAMCVVSGFLAVSKLIAVDPAELF